MLHDYYFYDWHNKNKGFRLHGYKHPRFALENAKKDFALNEIEEDIIIKHMFPLTIAFPKYKESWIVTKMDKKATRLEMAHTMIDLEFLFNKSKA